jgi:hypothetical protein
VSQPSTELARREPRAVNTHGTLDRQPGQNEAGPLQLAQLTPPSGQNNVSLVVIEASAYGTVVTAAAVEPSEKVAVSVRVRPGRNSLA